MYKSIFKNIQLSNEKQVQLCLKCIATIITEFLNSKIQATHLFLRVNIN